MKLTLVRYSYGPTETEGRLLWEGTEPWWTLEQPWLDNVNGNAFPSGAPHKSCLPEGEYKMEPFTRPDGHRTWALENHTYGVYVYKGQREHDWQRFLCLFHKGNFVEDTEGCILPGMSRALLANEDRGHRYQRAVGNSALAMSMLRDELGELTTGHTLTIVQQRGALYAGE